jgi:hypothetical protein
MARTWQDLVRVKQDIETILGVYLKNYLGKILTKSYHEKILERLFQDLPGSPNTFQELRVTKEATMRILVVVVSRRHHVNVRPNIIKYINY